MKTEDNMYSLEDILSLIELSQSPVVILDKEGNAIASNRSASMDKELSEGFINGMPDMVQTLNLSNDFTLVTRNHPQTKENEISSILLSNFTHELRTPLNSIQGMTKLSREICTQPELQEYLGHIEKSVHVLSDFVYILIEYMTIMKGNLVLNAKKTDLEEFLIDSTRSHVRKAQEKGINFSLYIAPELPDVITIDSERLHMICDQIIGNAVKFTEKGTIWVKITLENAQIKIVVSDEGVGISQEFVHRVYNPFEQEVYQYTRKQGGSGIGLTIVKKLIEAMDGTIDIESKKNAGTRVTILLPCQNPSTETLGSHYKKDVEKWILLTNKPVIEDIFSQFSQSFSIPLQVETSLSTVVSNLTYGSTKTLVFLDDSSIPMDELEDLHKKIPHGIRLQGFCQATATTIPLQGLTRLVYPFTPKTLGKLFDQNLGGWKKSMIQSKDMFSDQRILIVEDDAINLLSVVRFFTSRGAIVFQAGHVHKAVEILKLHPIDLALVDIGLPEVSGFELLRMIKEGTISNVPTTLPVIALTAYSSQDDQMRMKVAGFREILHKPYQPEALAKHVYTIVNEFKKTEVVKLIDKIDTYLKHEQYSKIERLIEQKKLEINHLSQDTDKELLETLLLKCLIAARSENKEKLLELVNHEMLKNL